MKDFGDDSSVIEEILSHIIHGIAERSVGYYHKTNQMDHVFLNSEGELHATVTPSISNLTPIFKTEFPAKRKYSKTGRRGHVDYWIFYKNIAFILELKLAHKGFARGDCTTSERIFLRFKDRATFIKHTKKVMAQTLPMIRFISSMYVLSGDHRHEAATSSNSVLAVRCSSPKCLRQLLLSARRYMKSWRKGLK